MEGKKPDEIQAEIYEAFSELAKSMGFSPIHGSIIGALIVGGGSLSLQEMSKRTGYSISMISLSLDLLELLDIVKKVKKSRDRNLYIELKGDLLESLKKIFLMRVKKSIQASLEKFEESRKKLEKTDGEKKDDVLRAVMLLEKEIKRLDKYVTLLSEMKLP